MIKPQLNTNEAQVSHEHDYEHNRSNTIVVHPGIIGKIKVCQSGTKLC